MRTSENEALGGSIATRGKAETSTPDREAVMIWRRPDDGQSVDAANSQKLEAETASSTAVPSAVRPSRAASLLHHIVIVGGGAAGLELATKLGDRLGQREKAEITLIELARTDIWKPHLHEVAAGTMDVGREAVDYLAQDHCFATALAR